MAATTPPIERSTLETPRRRLPARRAVWRACWLAIDGAAVLGCLAFAVHALA